MAKTHMTMKELKHDAVQDAGRSVFDYIQENSTRILTVVAGIVLVIAVVQIGMGLSARRARAASELMVKARGLYGNAIYAAEAVERDRILETAVQECMNVRVKYPSSEAARRSYLLEGNCQILRGDHEKALQAFQQFMGKARSSEERAAGHLAIGYASENLYFANRDHQDKRDAARQAYEAAAQAGPGGERSYVGWEAMLALARLHRLNGDLEKSAAIYREIAAARPYHATQAKRPDALQEFEGGRAAQSAQLRENVREVLSLASFQKTAENALEEVEAQMALAAQAADAAR